MARHVSAREARARFAELTDRVRYTGEAVVVEKQGRPFVALVSLDDYKRLEHLRRSDEAAEFSRLTTRAAHEADGTEPADEDEIVASVKLTRAALYREFYGDR